MQVQTKSSMKKLEVSLPSIRQSQRNPVTLQQSADKKPSGMRVVNFGHEQQDGSGHHHYNISQQINKMIPVRGPTIFERQMNEFLHGPASKSGGVKKLGTMSKKISLKMVRSSTHNVVNNSADREM